jgi:hypothetical protein
MFSRNKIIHGLFDHAPGLFSLFLPKNYFCTMMDLAIREKRYFRLWLFCRSYHAKYVSTKGEIRMDECWHLTNNKKSTQSRRRSLPLTLICGSFNYVINGSFICRLLYDTKAFMSSVTKSVRETPGGYPKWTFGWIARAYRMRVVL